MLASLLLGLGCLVCLLGWGIGEAIGKSVICQTDLDEPSLLEILQSALPRDIRKGSSELFDAASSINVPLHWKLPLASFFSQGEYLISFDPKDPSFTFKDIAVYEESFSQFNILCNFLTHYLPIGRGLCSCTGVDREDVSLLPQSGASYCSLPSPCSTADFQNRLCKVNVDPFRKSCLVITSQKPLSSNVVVYTKHAPSLSAVLSFFIPEDFSTDSVGINQGLALLRNFLELVPMHLVCFLAGLFVVIHARDLAESQMVQTFIQATVGILLATVLLLFILYRPIERIVSRYAGIATMLFPFSILSTVVSAVYRNPWVAKQIFFILVDFWREGAFGLPWLGKAYFGSSILFACCSSWYFNWFDMESRFFPVMLYTVRLFGLLLLYNGTASKDLAVLSVALGVLSEQIYPYARIWGMVMEAQMQGMSGARHSVRKISPEQAAEVSKKATKEALEKLRQHLQENKQELYKVSDKLTEGDKKDAAQLLQRFAQGQYGGVPSLQEADEVKERVTKFRAKPSLLSVYLSKTVAERSNTLSPRLESTEPRSSPRQGPSRKLLTFDSVMGLLNSRSVSNQELSMYVEAFLISSQGFQQLPVAKYQQLLNATIECGLIEQSMQIVHRLISNKVTIPTTSLIELLTLICTPNQTNATSGIFDNDNALAAALTIVDVAIAQKHPISPQIFTPLLKITGSVRNFKRIARRMQGAQIGVTAITFLLAMRSCEQYGDIYEMLVLLQLMGAVAGDGAAGEGGYLALLSLCIQHVQQLDDEGALFMGKIALLTFRQMQREAAGALPAASFAGVVGVLARGGMWTELREMMAEMKKAAIPLPDTLLPQLFS
eukprot:gene34059-41224_t